MKILFGVQATGNGHISRARALNTYLNALGADVDYIFSGRDPGDYFDMQEFKQPRFLRGLTLIHEQGRVLLNQTLAKNSLIKLVQDVQKTDTRRYDLVLTDFEPISAWAAKQQQTPCIGIGHQYAFYDAIPKAEDSALGRAIIRLVSPCSAYLGLHWHHFGQAILPPIVNLPAAAPKEKKRYLVYLAFEDPADILEFFEPFVTPDLNWPVRRCSWV
jgi:uncharacterized protein (TIGR00661 family)